MIRTHVRLHECDGAGGDPPSPTDHPCSVCGTPEAARQNTMVEMPLETYELAAVHIFVATGEILPV